jgi:dephospho-CoA kinase
MLVIAVTGGIGSGKSTVAELFQAKGIPNIDTDKVARKLVRPGSPLLQQIAEEFGREFITVDGQLDRKALREHIFANSQARHRLEALMHPAIHAEVMEQIQMLDAPYCLLLIPLLAANPRGYTYDRVLLIDAAENVRAERAAERDDQDPGSIRPIITSQPSREQMLAIADDVLDNNGDPNTLTTAVGVLHQKYLALARSNS